MSQSGTFILQTDKHYIIITLVKKLLMYSPFFRDDKYNAKWQVLEGGVKMKKTLNFFKPCIKSDEDYELFVTLICTGLSIAAEILF